MRQAQASRWRRSRASARQVLGTEAIEQFPLVGHHPEVADRLGAVSDDTRMGTASGGVCFGGYP